MAHIILLEPDRILAEAYYRGLTVAGHSVTACASAQAAIMAADQQTPDVVVMELQLIEHSGIEFLYEFRSYSDWQNIPVIINSFVPSREFINNQKILKKHLKVVYYHNKAITTTKQLINSVNKSLAKSLL